MNYAHYPTPPPGYMPYPHDYYRTPPVSPAPAPHGGYYPSPRYAGPTATPSPRVSPKVSGHARRASQAAPPPYYSSREGTPQYFPSYNSPRYNATPQQHPPEYVSGFDYVRHSRHRRTSDVPPLKRSHRERQHRSSHSRPFVYNNAAYDNDYEYNYESPPPPYQQYAWNERDGNADYYYYNQVPIFAPAEPKANTARPRRASHSSRPQQPPPPKRPSTSSKAATKATDDDARRAGIPAGYSIKNWDPTEEPIMLLGSVFDANSLGKWIYDWTVFAYGPAHPLAEMAGELWLLLIQLAGKVKRAEELMPKIRKQENRELVDDFLESGERLWIRFAKLLKVCEDYMWKAAKKETGEKKPAAMGKNSGCEFVDSIFGRDRELEKTEKLMTGMRLWSMRFDANCEDILRFPSA